MATPKREDLTDQIIQIEKTANRAEKAATSLFRTGGIELPNVTTPPAVPASGGILYVQAGVLKYVGAGGTRTTIAPS